MEKIELQGNFQRLEYERKDIYQLPFISLQFAATQSSYNVVDNVFDDNIEMRPNRKENLMLADLMTENPKPSD